jgi:hypothetical protein
VAKDEQGAVDGEVTWIAAADNPWGVPLLDVRPITLTMQSTSRDPSCAKNAISFGGDDGTSFIRQLPLSTREVSASLRYPIDRVLADGVLFTPHMMEHKWALFVHTGELIFVRSWTRRVQLTARIEVDAGNAVVTRVRGTFLDDDEPPELTLRLLDYLIRSHALGDTYPVTLPLGVEEDPNTAALWCMSMFGNRALFATPDQFAWSEPSAPLRSHSLLHIAVARGSVPQIDAALAAGIPIDVLAGDGLAPLHWALANDDPAILLHLLERGSPVDVRSAEGATPLMNAIQSARATKARLLLEHGADVNATDQRGFTALHRAAEMGLVELAQLLLEHGARADVRAGDHTPLSLALERGKGELAELLERREGF